MIPRTSLQGTDRPNAWPLDWREEFRQAIRDPEHLLEILSLPKSQWLQGARRAAKLFPLRVPRGFVARMRLGDPNDPLLRQVLPLDIEHAETQGYRKDPVGDLDAITSPGLLHKYSGRALVIATGACAIHCRYCFRRHFPYAEAHAGGSNLPAILASIAATPDIEEIILSGGDPLMLDDEQFGRMLRAFSNLAQIKRIRIHSRLPIVLPQRITPVLLDNLANMQQAVIMVIHSNHAQEIDEHVSQALQRLHHAGLQLFNQSVLLKSINDDAPSLIHLSKTLFENHTLPYYLHLLDAAQGTAHFEVSEQACRSIYQQVQAALPGYLVPKLVREIQGESSKTLINV